MIELGKRYKTRDGRDVTVFTVEGPSIVSPVVGWIHGYSNPDCWTRDGRFAGPGSDYPLDLIEVRRAEDVVREALDAVSPYPYVQGPQEIVRALSASGHLKDGDSQ